VGPHERLGGRPRARVVDGAPSNVKEGVGKAEAAEMKTRLEEVGATVVLK
jgi:large subunit ribosomal protein L7/L12